VSLIGSKLINLLDYLLHNIEPRGIKFGKEASRGMPLPNKFSTGFTVYRFKIKITHATKPLRIPNHRSAFPSKEGEGRIG
jgi:hypothetical protein